MVNAPQRRFAAGEVALATLFFASVLAFLPLYAPIMDPRGPAVVYVLTRVLPAFVVHALLFGLTLRWQRTAVGALVLWGGSLAVLLALGGPLRAASIAAAVAVAVLAALAGRTICRQVFDLVHVKWPLSLLFGCGVVSVVVTYLATFHQLYAGTLVGAVGAIAALGFVRVQRRDMLSSATPTPNDQDGETKKERRKRRQGQRSLQSATQLETQSERPSGAWTRQLPLSNYELALLEIAFLLLSVLIVCASAPELNSDAVRMYVPHLKLLDLFNGFYGIPQMWSFIIPQAAITYAESFYVTFGPAAARYAMLVALVATGAVIATFERFSAASMATAVVVCSTPFVARLGSSLMLDVFVALTVLLVATTAVRGRVDRLLVYFGAIGAAIGLAWCAKYTTIIYAAPLGLYALWRASRATSVGRAVGSALIAVPAGAAATAGPWLVRTWRESGNPVFPFFLDLFPAPLWPRGVMDISDLFPLPEWWRVLLAPVEFTYRTSKYIEGFNGAMGLTLIVLFLGAIVAVWRGDSVVRITIVAAAVGAAGVWITSAYLRYWMPTLFLLGLGVAMFLSRQQMLRRHAAAAVLTAAIAVSVALPVFAASSWFDPTGVPWDFYSGKTSFDEYLARRPGFEAMRELKKLDPNFPRVLQTKVETASHWPVIPIEAMKWEFAMHGVSDAQSAQRWIESYNADYWAVNRSDIQGKHLEAMIGTRYFRDELRIASAGPVEIFAIPESARARAALQIIANRPAPEELSRNGSFEESDFADGVDGWNVPGEGVERRSDGRAKDGLVYLRVTRAPGATQVIDVSGTAAIRVSEWIRASSPTPRDVRLQVNWLATDGKLLSSTIEVITPSAEWKEYTTKARVPDGASAAIVYLANHDPAAVTDFDAVKVVAVEE